VQLVDICSIHREYKIEVVEVLCRDPAGALAGNIYPVVFGRCDRALIRMLAFVPSTSPG